MSFSHNNNNNNTLKGIHQQVRRMSTHPSLRATYVHAPRFTPGSEDSRKFLKEYGYVVIKALSETEAAHAVDLTWEYLESLGTGIKRNDYKTWNKDQWPTAVHGAILPGHGIGHSKPQWYVRGHPNIKKAFAGIWQTTDLLASFDGMSLFRPWKLNEEWRTNPSASWFHIDQHPLTRPGFQCVQSLVNLLPMSKKTGGNVLIPKSHLDFVQIPIKYEKRLSRIPKEVDHFRYPANDPLLAKNAAIQPIQVHLEVGDMLLWDSRTIHCSSPSMEEPDTEAKLMRCVNLICMMPRRLTPEHVIERRKQAPLLVNSTTNWTDRWINADEFPQLTVHRDMEKYPNTNGYKYKRPDPPQLNKHQLLLVGYTEEEIDNGAYPYYLKESSSRL